MTITAGILPSYDLSSLSEVTIRDASTFTGTNTVFDINQVRFLFTTVNQQAALEEDVTECLAWTEYVVTSGTAVARGTSYTTGQTMHFAIDTTPTGTWTADATGYYGGYNTFLPTTAAGTTFTPSQTGYSTEDTSYADNVFTLRYELYSTKTGAGAVSVGSSTQFIVMGTVGGTITITTQTFYVGEVFTKSSNFTFADGTGTNYVVAIADTVTAYFRTWAENFAVYEDYLNAIATNQCGTDSAALYSNFVKVNAMIGVANLSESRQYNVGLENIQTLMDKVNDYYGVKDKCCL